MEERILTSWRPWVLVAHDVQIWLISSMPAHLDYATDATKAFREHPRKRTLQTLPKQVDKLWAVCQQYRNNAFYQ
ncbi:hypothetical protein BCS42_03085 [Crenothrix sp. D3]|nr:hypothetical protein BCS42_03085 [Crenothrix sp. D3]